MKAPFPYFGGKSAVADIVWQALGQPKHYIEPFFGSGAVLLARPEYEPGMIESVCDKDGFLANVWRALQSNPDEVAKWCDWPVNHADLSARKKRLITNEEYLVENLIKDDTWCDSKLAGYWIWATSCWIGSGLTRPNAIPHISDGGQGVHAIGGIPHISDGGQGVHARGAIPHIGHGGKGVQEPYKTTLYSYFRQLSERLRYVRVVCGDWTRICGGEWQNRRGVCGMFFDPPYSDEDRDTQLYHHDSISVGKDVEKWCLERGKLKTYRIVVAGYDSEYKTLINDGWTVKKWLAQGGYSSAGKKDTRGQINRHRETLLFSPYCLMLKENCQKKLF